MWRPPGSGTPGQGFRHLSVLRRTCLVAVTRFLPMAPKVRAGFSECLKAVVMRTVWGPCPEGDTVMITVFLEVELKLATPQSLPFLGPLEQSPGLAPPTPPGGPCAATVMGEAHLLPLEHPASGAGSVEKAHLVSQDPHHHLLMMHPTPTSLWCAFNCSSLCFSQRFICRPPSWEADVTRPQVLAGRPPVSLLEVVVDKCTVGTIASMSSAALPFQTCPVLTAGPGSDRLPFLPGSPTRGLGRVGALGSGGPSTPAIDAPPETSPVPLPTCVLGL